ncbi:glycosyltransferase [Peribacillus muralis]|uniref:glycosyltransferase n=1 Tax=Peribacillus muralis TaxID=264697 RepID=UPI00070F26DE|nr:glycosyltransferase [Peribacillus muralis]
MKKELLFVINNLNCGGAEKALISLLETIDYSRFNVDLFLFKHEGLFFSKIPKDVTLLKEPVGYKYYDMSIKKATTECLKTGKLKTIYNRIHAGFIFKKEKNKAKCEQKVWKLISKSINKLEKEYDIAIGYLEKNPIYFCVDKVNAKKKIGFIHNDYDKLGMDPKKDYYYFTKLDFLVTVSEECAKVLRERFPQFSYKVSVMNNIISSRIVNKMALAKIDQLNSKINIVTVGRLNYQKGYEMAIKACKYLVEEGYEFVWYVIGEGTERPKLQKLIVDNELSESFVLLGIKENPYPYIKQADLYVQTSRFEGKSIAIDEAKILNKPIVVTNFTTAKDQINHNENGIIVNMNSLSIAKGIKTLIDNEELRLKLSKNLSKEKLGNEFEINKLYEMIT